MPASLSAMTTTYRFPAVLGALEHEAAANQIDYPKVGFDLDGVTGRPWLYRIDLTLVEPPLPNGSATLLEEAILMHSAEAERCQQA